MRLWYSPTSPFARKVRAAIIHHQLDDQLELLETNTAEANPPHTKDNPLGKIPALEIKPGYWLYDSPVIAEYIDSIGKSESLFPTDASRWHVLKQQATADGLVDNAIIAVIERLRREDKQFWHGRHQQLISCDITTLKLLDEQIDELGTTLNIGNLSMVCALDWLIVREKVLEINIADIAPKLTTWATQMNQQHTCLGKTLPPK